MSHKWDYEQTFLSRARDLRASWEIRRDWLFLRIKNNNFYVLDIIRFEKHLRCLCIHRTAREHRLEVREKNEVIREKKRMQNGVRMRLYW